MIQIGKGRRYEVRQVTEHTIDGKSRPQITVLHSADLEEEAASLAETLRHSIADETSTMPSKASRALLNHVTIDVFDAGPAPRT